MYHAPTTIRTSFLRAYCLTTSAGVSLYESTLMAKTIPFPWHNSPHVIDFASHVHPVLGGISAEHLIGLLIDFTK